MMAIPLFLQAQDIEQVDTLPPALKIGSRRIITGTGSIKADIQTARQIVSPTGEGDALKLIQTLPGVSSGAEGASAILVRGGNIGNNLMTLDGIPVYGISHLMGVTSTVPTGIIQEIDFQTGGFKGDRNPLLASHIQLQSAQPSLTKAKTQILASTFILGADAAIPLNDQTGLMVAGRLSPIQWEYNAIKGFMTDINAIRDMQIGAFDLYGKLFWNLSPNRQIQAWVFGSRDIDRFNVDEGIWLGLTGTNLLGAIQYEAKNTLWTHHACLSFNYYANAQELIADRDNTWNIAPLTMNSSLKEFTLESKWSRPMGPRLTVSFGVQGKMAIFQTLGQHGVPWTGTLWGQADWKEEGRYHLMGAFRANLYGHGKNVFFLPEMDLLAEWGLTDWLTASLTADHLVQFYHTLEGLPLGWNADLMVPADAVTPPENAWQTYAGLRANLRNHHFSVGGYYKHMKNLVHYTEAAAVFSTTRTDWKGHVDTGDGTSYGLELMYEYSDNVFYGKAAYTLSKTTRQFPGINEGEPFPAKFDRPHMLNLGAEWTLNPEAPVRHSLSTAFTLESGFRESVKAYSYPSQMPYFSNPVDLPFYGKHPNNYRMPTYIRLDLGYNLSITKGPWHHNIQLGVYNVLNRHNPFLLSFNYKNKNWEELSLFPILPNFSYRLSF